MENDMLSLMTINEDTKALATKVFRMTGIIVILAVMFSILALIEWYEVFGRAKFVTTRNFFYWYNFVIRPAVAVTIITMALGIHVWNYKAYGAIVSAIKNQDHLLLNKGLRYTYTGYLLSIISFVIAILSSSARFLL